MSSKSNAKVASLKKTLKRWQGATERESDLASVAAPPLSLCRVVLERLATHDPLGIRLETIVLQARRGVRAIHFTNVTLDAHKSVHTSITTSMPAHFNLTNLSNVPPFSLTSPVLLSCAADTFMHVVERT